MQNMIVGRRSLSAFLLIGASSPAAAESLPAQAKILSLNVRDFGAVGDGQTDDTASINAAFQAARIRNKEYAQFGPIGCKIFFPAGLYLIKSTINATNIRGINTVIDGDSSVILAQCDDMPAIDALGSRWLTVKDLTIIGSDKHVPTIGIALGCANSEAVADDHLFANVKIVGSFSLCCLYNRSGETSTFEHMLLWNHASKGYCLVQDGINNFNITSSFLHNDLPAKTSRSFNENLFINCDIRHTGQGIPIWVGGTSRHSFLRCYAATDGDRAVVIFGNNSMLEVDCHFETAKLATLFFVDSFAEKVALRSFVFREHECFASSFVFQTSPHIASVEMPNCRLEIATFLGKDVKIFCNPKLWKASGSYSSDDTNAWNGDDALRGTVTLGLEVYFLGVAR